MDFRIFEAINDWAATHAGFTHALAALDTALTVLLVLGTLALWLAARPGGTRKWKLAAVSALGSGGLAYVLNQVVHTIHDRPRPYEGHPSVWHPYATSTDASFPSDHTSAAFAIAWAVFLYDRAVGAAFLVVAGLLSWIRVLVGFHYPGDVLAGMLMGLLAALIVRYGGRPLVAALVRAVERLTDPVLRPLWRR
jgi:undecaprenyl-diphosphatase